MPYQYEEDKEKNAQQNTSGGIMQSTEPGVVSEGSSTPKQTKQKLDTPTGFTNINQYLEQNKDQAVELANRLGGIVQTGIQKGYKAITDADKAYKGEVEKGTTALGPTKLLNADIAKQNMANYNAAQNDTSGFAGDQGNVKWFQDVLAAKYEGPKFLEDWSGYNDLFKTTQSSKDIADKYKTQQGRNSLISQILGNKLTGGGLALNSMLLQGNPGAMSELEKQSQQNIDTRMKALANSAFDYSQEGMDLTEEAPLKLKMNFDPEITKKQIDLRIKRGNDDNQRYIDDLRRSYIGAVDVAPYVSLTTPDIYNVASAADYARMDALSKLYQDPTIGQYLPMSKLGQAGTYANRSFDVNRWAADSATKQAEIDKAMKNDRIVANPAPTKRNLTAVKTSLTVICTELHRQGYFNDEVLKLDEQFGKDIRKTSPWIYDGYMTWAPTVVGWMQKSKIVTKIVAPFGVAWANYMAGKSSFLGKAILTVGMKICGIIGKLKLYNIVKEY